MERRSLAEHRDAAADHLADSPSLRGALEEGLGKAYRRARRDTAYGTGLREGSFPAVCPWSLTELLAEDPPPEG